jgi:uncharacterized membrane protein
MKANRSTGIAMAMAAASLFAAVPMTAHASQDSKVHCYGVNKCAGQNDCKTANNSCKGQGSCAGQGFLNMSKQACKKAGGTVKDDKK